jgi:glycosyltransferase involved in cell wall biosynthesis
VVKNLCWQPSDFRLYHDEVASDYSPTFSVVVPVFNQEHLIKKVLTAIKACMVSNWELIVVDDSSDDNTRNEILGWANEFGATGVLQRIRLYHSNHQMFETACDSFGFSQIGAPFIIEIQADMILQDHGFDRRFLDAFVALPELVIASGRGVDTFVSAFGSFLEKGGLIVARGKSPMLHAIKTVVSLLNLPSGFLVSNKLEVSSKADTSPLPEKSISKEIFPGRDEFLASGRAGRLGDLMDYSVPHSVEDFKKLWIGESVMRGPLFIRAELLNAIGGLDTDSFFLGFDDHELCYRASLKGYAVGFHPVNFVSPEEWGSSRKKRTFSSEYAVASKFFSSFRNLRKSKLWSVVANQTYPEVSKRIVQFLE